MRRIYATRRGEYWIRFDDSAAVYELFRSEAGDDYIGCFDSPAEALAYAKRHAQEAV